MNDQTERPKNQVSVLRDYLNSQEIVSALNKVMPNFLTADKILSIALSEARKTPKLLNCDKMSFANCIVKATQMGLIIGSSFGQAYLVPFGKECTLMPGYRGYVVLAERAGTALTGHCVCENDPVYKCLYGSAEQIKHEPAINNRGKIICAYAVARKQVIRKDGSIITMQKIDHMSMEELEKREACTKTDGSFYKKWRKEMYRKAPVRRLAKYLDLSPEFEMLREIDNTIDSGMTIDSVFTEEPEAPLLPQNEKMKQQMKAKQPKNQETLL